MKSKIQKIINKEPKIAVLLQQMWEYDPNLYNHSMETANLVDKMLESSIYQYDYDDEEKEELIVAALVHDIGMISVNKDIYNKLDLLNKEEYSEVKNHTIVGEKIVTENKFNNLIREITSKHHIEYKNDEHPEKKDKHSLLQKVDIVKVADIYTALREQKPYRKEKCHEESISHIKLGMFEVHLIMPSTYYAILEVTENY